MWQIMVVAAVVTNSLLVGGSQYRCEGVLLDYVLRLGPLRAYFSLCAPAV
jgi:hypothetical protein